MKYVLVSDLDETLIGDSKGIMELNEVLSSNRGVFYLVYSSGRFKNSIMSLIKSEGLIQPDAIVSNVGTEIYYSPNWNADKEWERTIAKNWSKEKIVSILDRFGLTRQPYEKDFAVPYYIEDGVKVSEIKKTLAGHGVKVVHTKKRCLDVFPEIAGKGNAAEYIANKLNLPVICCGDSENDEDMLKKSDFGILVGNAFAGIKRDMSKHPNIYISKSHYAKGVIEGLKFHGII